MTETTPNFPSAALDDLYAGKLRYLADKFQESDQIQPGVPFLVAVNTEGEVWVYFPDEYAEEFGEVAREVKVEANPR